MGLESRYDFVFKGADFGAGCRVLGDYLVAKASRDGGATASGRTFRFAHPWVEHPAGLDGGSPGRDYLVLPVGLLRHHPEDYSTYEEGDYDSVSPPFALEGEDQPEFFALEVSREVLQGETHSAIRLASSRKSLAHLMVADDSLRFVERLASKTGAEFVHCRCDYSEWLFAAGLSLRADSATYRLEPASWTRDVDSLARSVEETLRRLRAPRAS